MRFEKTRRRQRKPGGLQQNAPLTFGLYCFIYCEFLLAGSTKLLRSPLSLKLIADGDFERGLLLTPQLLWPRNSTGLYDPQTTSQASQKKCPTFSCSCGFFDTKLSIQGSAFFYNDRLFAVSMGYISNIL